MWQVTWHSRQWSAKATDTPNGDCSSGTGTLPYVGRRLPKHLSGSFYGWKEGYLYRVRSNRLDILVIPKKDAVLKIHYVDCKNQYLSTVTVTLDYKVIEEK